jgi:anti-anti-sigma factor
MQGGLLKLRLQARVLDGTPVLECYGRIIYSEECSALSDAAQGWMKRLGRVLVDLNGVQGIDSGGLGAIVALHVWAGQNDCAIAYMRPSGIVRQLLSLTRLDKVLSVFDSEQDALLSLRQAA